MCKHKKGFHHVFDTSRVLIHVMLSTKLLRWLLSTRCVLNSIKFYNTFLLATAKEVSAMDNTF